MAPAAPVESPNSPPEVRDEEPVAGARRPVGNRGRDEAGQPHTQRIAHARNVRRDLSTSTPSSRFRKLLLLVGIYTGNAYRASVV